MLNILKEKNALTNLLYLNIAVFVLINLLKVLMYLFQNTIDISFLCVSSNINILITKPWTLITYMFVHEDLFHIIVNLFWLYFSGKIFINYLSPNKLFSTYLMGGIIGAILYIIAFNVFPVFDTIKSESIAMGASASVLAILIASATHVPDYSIRVFTNITIKLKYIAITAVIIDILSIQHGNAGGHIAHLGGALYGYIYISLRKKNINTGYIIEQLILLISKNNTIKSKKRSESDYEYNARKHKEQTKINSILEKISRSGYDSLSSEEKNELFKHK